MAVNLKTETPDTTLPAAGFLFGADSQSASAPSVYPMSALISLLFGSTAFSGSLSNTLVLSGGAAAQNLRVYNTYTDASNYEVGVFDWSSSANVLTIGTTNAGTGSARNLRFLIGGVNKLDFGVTNAGAWSLPAGSAFNALGNGMLKGGMNVTNGNFGSPFGVPTITSAYHGVEIDALSSVFLFADNNILKFGGITSSYPALKRSSTALQARLADDSGFTFIQGKHQTDATYVATPQTNTGYLTMYDSTGTAYKVMVAA